MDDLERLVKDQNTQLSVNDHIARPSQLRRAHQRHIWLHLGWAMSLAFVFVVGYLGGAKSAASSSTTAPWVAGPFGAPYSNSPIYEQLDDSKPVSVKATHIGGHNPYTGGPNEQTGKTWKSLMRGYNIRVPRWLLQPGQDSIPLADGSDDVVGSLGVFHYLHCLDSIRHQIAGKGCHDNDWGKEGILPAHFDHCIESLRQWLMCQPDLTLRTTYWTTGDDGEVFAQANNTVEHTCVDWSVVAKWTQERELSNDDGLVRTPKGDIWPWIMSAPPICSTHDAPGS